MFCRSFLYFFFWPLYCLSFDTVYGYPFGIFWPLYCLSFDTVSGYPFGIFWPLYCLSFDTVSGYPFGIVWPLYCLSFDTISGYPFGIFKHSRLSSYRYLLIEHYGIHTSSLLNNIPWSSYLRTLYNGIFHLPKVIFVTIPHWLCFKRSLTSVFKRMPSDIVFVEDEM